VYIVFLYSYRFEGSSGSAITGIQLISGAGIDNFCYDGKIIAAGYDQRLAVWRINVDHRSRANEADTEVDHHDLEIRKPVIVPKGSTPLEDRGVYFSWEEGFILDVGDVQGLVAKEVVYDGHPGFEESKKRHYAIVAGEGFQVFRA
jgi:hypothetical protein